MQVWKIVSAEVSTFQLFGMHEKENLGHAYCRFVQGHDRMLKLVLYAIDMHDIDSVPHSLIHQ